MIHPSYVDLMKVVNQNVEEGETPVINSRYSIVMATAKRARQLVDGDEPLVEGAEGKKPLSVAVEELNEAKIRILTEEEHAADEERVRAEIEAMKAGEETQEDEILPEAPESDTL
ncbi:MAG: DNA-directed RNA polymerase subunit omega [Lachnospiraceae bacterium]|nr:DNA-directed RNA polymerase subunit omega [Lachnospiraceae bacterium]